MSDKFYFRCGWCGLPTDSTGEPLTDHSNWKSEGAIQLNGLCCPNGDGSSERQRVTRDMAIDAGYPELEGEYF